MRRGLLSVALYAGLLGFLSFGVAWAEGRDAARLSLDECLHTALANNLDLVSAKMDPEIAAKQIGLSEAPFDGIINANVTVTDTDAEETIFDNSPIGPPFSGINPDQPVLGGTDSDDLTTNVSFSHLLDFGGTYTLAYDWFDQDFLNTSVPAQTGQLTTFSQDSTNEGVTLRYEMPLLKGFGKEANTVDTLVARGNLEISREDLRLQAILTIQSVEDAYWDVRAAIEDLKISRLSLKRAEDLLELNRKKVEVGTLAPIEITEAEAGVASQVERVIVAETNLENAEDILLQLMAVPETDVMWDQSLELTKTPSFAPVEVDLDEAIATAMERRPEINSARQRLEDDGLRERVKKRGLWHQLDLIATLTPERQTVQDQTVDRPDAVIPGVGTVSQDSDTSSDGDQTDWSAELQYTYSWGNRAAKADYAIAKLNTAKSELALQSIEQEIRVDVRRAVRNLQSGLQRVEAASKNVELQQKKLEAEEKKFDNGMSTSFEVLTFQNDLADAELGQIRAALDYLKSLTALEKSKGTLLESRNLALAE